MLGTVTEWNGKADASFVFRCSDLTGLEAEAVVSIFQDVATADEAIYQSVLILASPRTVAHSLKVRLGVMMTLVPCVAFDDAVTSLRG